jgi:hypothetical protein
MPKNQVSDPITDQEIAYAHLILSGTMTDRRAAEAVGLNPDTAAYTKRSRSSARRGGRRACVPWPYPRPRLCPRRIHRCPPL